MGFQETFNERVIPAANRAFGVSATLKRGAIESEPFTAQWADVHYEVADSEGFITRFDGRDFMFAVTDSVLDGEAVKPREGDRIAFSENTIPVEFEVLPVGTRPAVERMAGGFRWRVHTKKRSSDG